MFDLARRLGAILCVAAATAFAAPAAGAGSQNMPPAWEIDQEASSIVATGRQMGSRVPARFEEFSGEVRFAADRLDRSRIAFEIDVASIRAANEDVETEAKSEDWFDVERHPTARFESSEFRDLEDGRYEVTGDLTIKGVTKEVAVPFELSAEEAPSGDAVIGTAEGEFTIQRLDFGVGKGEWGDTSIVSDEVTIRITMKGRRPK